MKKKLTEKDLTQIIQKVLNEVQTLEPFHLREKRRVNTYKLFDTLSQLQSYIRNKNMDLSITYDVINILESEIEYLKNQISR